VRRLSASIFATLLLVGLCAPATFAAAPAALATVPKVVFVVGPSGASTEGNRAQARVAASIARHYTPDVTELYSPNATWPAVKAALKGASLVVYMGHGNGWPSRYRDDLFPATQNGLGLNPTRGGGDSTHQYFGEAMVGSELKLAKNAVVLLNHLCYASGNTEPGLSEGTLDEARQRVDNYAAGFIRAGASAVIAEAWSNPNYFVRAILGGSGSIQNAWLRSPSANGHQFGFASERSPGYVAQMDPETRSAGFTRSIVMKSGLAPSDVLAGARGSASSVYAPLEVLVPSLTETGIALATPGFAGLPTAAAKSNLLLPFTIKDRKALPKGIQASIRWDPIDVATVAPVDPASEVGGNDPAAPDPAAPAHPATGDANTPPTAAVETGDLDVAPEAVAPSVEAALDEARGKQWIDPPTDAVGLIVPEQAGDVVAPVAVKVTKTAFQVPVVLPDAAGRYRLTVTLHDADGVAYDAATQALLPPLVVRVTGDFDGAITVAPSATVVAGGEAALGVRVENLGKKAWGRAAIKTPSAKVSQVPAVPATVVARWIPLSAGAKLLPDSATHAASSDLPVGLAPGATADAWLHLSSPEAAGDYLLVLDVVTPDDGSLVASGANPTVVRITVVPAK